MSTASEEPSDEQLMARLQAGEDAALGLLMQRWEQPVRRFIFRLIGNTAEADDLAQEVFVRVYGKRETFRTGARFSSWVLTIAANQAKNRLRWWKRRPLLSLNAWLEQGGEAVDAGTSVEARQAHATREERIAEVQRAIADLPLAERTVIVLFEYEEKSMSEIAAILDCSPKAVEGRLYRARRRLAELLRLPGRD